MKDNVKYQQARAVLKRRIISFPNDGELRVESIIREFEDYAMIVSVSAMLVDTLSKKYRSSFYS